MKQKPEITVRQMMDMPEDQYQCVDIRSEIAYSHGHIRNAVYWNGNDDVSFPGNKKIIVYCTLGEKSLEFAEKLRKRGFDAYHLTGGYKEWLKYHAPELDNEEFDRYSRQIILPQVGLNGQLRLKHAKILIVGAGGLGSPVAMYLAGAGIGTIGIMDADTVNISNLQRHILYNTENTGLNKAESAKSVMQKLNHKITVTAYPDFLTAENAEQILSRYDFIIDAVDNFETKFLINDTCVLLKKPFCHAGILGFQGQVMTYVPGEEKPCYRCVFEEIPAHGTIPDCSQSGILGAVAGIIGSIQALEAVKYILNIGELLTGKLFVLDGLTMKTRIVEFSVKNQNCRICGKNPFLKDSKQIRTHADEYLIRCEI